MNTILRFIELYKKETDNEKRKTMYDLFFKKNATFREYIDMMHNEKYIPLIDELPFYEDDGSPSGYNFSKLEMQLSKIKTALYNISLDEKRRNTILMQICEAISKDEVDFLQDIMNKKSRLFIEE